MNIKTLQEIDKIKELLVEYDGFNKLNQEFLLDKRLIEVFPKYYKLNKDKKHYIQDETWLLSIVLRRIRILDSWWQIIKKRVPVCVDGVYWYWTKKFTTITHYYLKTPF